MTEEEKLLDHQVFSIATLIYARLRRISGRVVDALYMADDKAYARYVVQLAEATEDEELNRLTQRLRTELQLDEAVEIEEIPEKLNDLETVEPTQEDVYQAQVSHHYIGALR